MVYPLKQSKKSVTFDLQLAIIENNLEKLISIININQVDLNSVTFITKCTPLSFAIYHKLYEVVKALLKAGSNPNRISYDSLGRIEPPLCSAVRLGTSNILKLLLESPTIIINETDFFGQTPLWLAVRERRTDFVSQIVNHKKFRLNSKSFRNKDSNPVYLSCKYLNQGRGQILKILINIGFKVDKESLNFVLNYGDATIIRIIENSNGKVITKNKCNKSSVLSLKQLSRVIIRDTFVNKTWRPINFVEINKHFSLLPTNLVNFLINLE